MQDNNFYEEYAHDIRQFNKFSLVLDAVKADFDQAIDNVRQDLSIAAGRTYKTIPIRSLNTADIVYSIDDLLLDHKLVVDSGIGERYTPIATRLNNWIQAKWSKKNALLELAGQYVQVIYGDTPPKIVSLEIWTPDEVMLTENIDYSFSDDKIFFYDLSTSPAFSYDMLNIKNIVVDVKIPETQLLPLMPFEYIDAYSKPQYNAILKAFIKCSALGGTIGILNESLQEFEPESLYGALVRCFDFYSATPAEKKKYWNILNDGAWTPALNRPSIFDAYLILPSQYMQDLSENRDSSITRMDYLTKFLNIIKPAHIRMHPIVSYGIEDTIFAAKADKIKMCVKVHSLLSSVSFADKTPLTIKARVVEKIDHFEYTNSIYDDKTRYSAGQQYDTYNSFEEGIEAANSAVTLADQILISIVDRKA